MASNFYQELYLPLPIYLCHFPPPKHTHTHIHLDINLLHLLSAKKKKKKASFQLIRIITLCRWAQIHQPDWCLMSYGRAQQCSHVHSPVKLHSPLITLFLQTTLFPKLSKIMLFKCLINLKSFFCNLNADLLCCVVFRVNDDPMFNSKGKLTLEIKKRNILFFFLGELYTRKLWLSFGKFWPNSHLHITKTPTCKHTHTHRMKNWEYMCCCMTNLKKPLVQMQHLPTIINTPVHISKICR